MINWALERLEVTAASTVHPYGSRVWRRMGVTKDMEDLQYALRVLYLAEHIYDTTPRLDKRKVVFRLRHTTTNELVYTRDLPW